MVDGIISTLTSKPSEPVQIYSESMDLCRFGSATHLPLFRDYLRAKYADRKVDVAIAVLGPPLDFLLNNGRTVFPGNADEADILTIFPESTRASQVFAEAQAAHTLW
jgi:hypothetical protein